MCHGGGVGEMTKRDRSEEVKHLWRWKRSRWLPGWRSNWFLAGNEFAVYKKLSRSLGIVFAEIPKLAGFLMVLLF